MNPRVFKVLLALSLIVAAFVLGPIAGFAPARGASKAPTVEELQARCQKEGGCALVTKKDIAELMGKVAEQAYQAGKRDADAKCGSLT